MNKNPGTVNWTAVFIPFFLLFCLFLAFGSYFTVSAGNVAVKLRFGELIGAYGEGIHFKLPLVDSVEKFSVRIKKDAFRTEAFSKDLQQQRKCSFQSCFLSLLLLKVKAIKHGARRELS